MSDDTWYIESNGRRRKGLKKNCCVCGKEFVCRADKPWDCCGSKCKGISKSHKNRIEVVCSYCNNNFTKPASKLSNSKSGLHFCSRKCKDLAQRIGGIEDIMPSHYGSATGRSLARRLKNNIINQLCIGCGEDRRYLLFLHHIDGNPNNNNTNNVEIVCGNCHIIRHLSLVNGIWVYQTSALTPRDLLSTFYESSKAVAS